MGWGQRWPERVPRPKARRLTETEKQDILRTLEQGIAASPVLSAFGVQARVQRGRFYIERYESGQDSEQFTIVLGRITPLTSAKNDLLLETERRQGSWFEVAEGSATKLIKVIASDSKGTFHGLGFLDASLRRLGEGQARLPVTLNDKRPGAIDGRKHVGRILWRHLPVCLPRWTVGGVHDQAQREQDDRSGRGLAGQATVAGVVMIRWRVLCE